MTLISLVSWQLHFFQIFRNSFYIIKKKILFFLFFEPKDIKIGIRTFLEEKNGQNFVKKEELINEPRQDLYEKILRLSSLNEKSLDSEHRADIYLTSEEKSTKTLTKKRFMEWRQKCTSSAKLGFRIEAINVN